MKFFKQFLILATLSLIWLNPAQASTACPAGYVFWKNYERCMNPDGCNEGWRLSADKKNCEQGTPAPVQVKNPESVVVPPNVRHNLCVNQYLNASTSGGAGASLCRNRCQQAGLVFVPAEYGLLRTALVMNNLVKKSLMEKVWRAVVKPLKSDLLEPLLK